jgi:hypothetical protein
LRIHPIRQPSQNRLDAEAAEPAQYFASGSPPTLAAPGAADEALMDAAQRCGLGIVDARA